VIRPPKIYFCVYIDQVVLWKVDSHLLPSSAKVSLKTYVTASRRHVNDLIPSDNFKYEAFKDASFLHALLHPSLTSTMSAPRRVTAMPSAICLFCARFIRIRARRYATVASSRPEIFDVVCVGGGPAGLGLLTALRKSHSAYFTLLYQRRLTNHRLITANIPSQTCPHRVPVPRPRPKLVTSPKRILQSSLLPHTRFCIFPPKDRRMAAYRPWPRSSIPPHARLGCSGHRFKNRLLRPSLIIEQPIRHSIHDRKPEPNTCSARSIRFS